MFDLGIVMAVAFLIAALSSLDLTSVLTDRPQSREAERTVSERSVIVDADEQSRRVRIEPGQHVVGKGRQIGRLYRLGNGRVVVVSPDRTGSGPSENGLGE